MVCYLFDTNILLRAANKTSSQHSVLENLALLTNNTSDFRRFGVTAISPDEVVKFPPIP
jgi:hypothetical protein